MTQVFSFFIVAFLTIILIMLGYILYLIKDRDYTERAFTDAISIFRAKNHELLDEIERIQEDGGHVVREAS